MALGTAKSHIIYRPISWHAGHTLFTNVAESVCNKKHYEKNKGCRKDYGHRYNLNFADEILHVLALAQKDDFVRGVYVALSLIHI